MLNNDRYEHADTSPWQQSLAETSTTERLDDYDFVLIPKVCLNMQAQVHGRRDLQRQS